MRRGDARPQRGAQERADALAALPEEDVAVRHCTEWLRTALQGYVLGLDYVTNDGGMSRPFYAPPVVANCFYRERIKKSAVQGGE